jgi:hypothetical protein
MNPAVSIFRLFECPPRTRRVALAVVGTALLLRLTRYERYEDRYCAICASERKTNDWGFGLSSDLRLPMAASDVVNQSAAFRDLCGADHVHVWRTDHVWDSNWIGGTCACNGWRVGTFAKQYERSAELRATVRREIAAGTLDRATALRLVAVPWIGYENARAVPGTPADAALRTVAGRLLRESGDAYGDLRVAWMARAPDGR